MPETSVSTRPVSAKIHRNKVYELLGFMVAILGVVCLARFNQCRLSAYFNAGMIELNKGLLAPASDLPHLDLAETYFARAAATGAHSTWLEGARAMVSTAQGDWRRVDRLIADDSLLEGVCGNVVRVALVKKCWQAGERDRAADLLVQVGDTKAVQGYTSSLMWQYYDAGEWEKALVWFERAYPFSPDDVDLEVVGADILWRLGRHSEALAVLEHAVAINPDSAHALHTLCWRYKHAGRLEEALAACRQSVAVDPGFVFTYGTMADVLLQLGQPYEAERVMLQGLSIDRGGALDHQVYLLGDIYRKTGRDEMAIAAYCQALDLHPTPERGEYIQRQLAGLNGQCVR